MTRIYDVVLDERGWAQADNRPSWRPDERKTTRRGLPWTPAEDKALLDRCAQAASVGYNDPTIRAAATAHGRSTCSITTRLCALRAGVRLAEQSKAASIDAFRRFTGRSLDEPDPQPASAALKPSPTSDSDAK